MGGVTSDFHNHLIIRDHALAESETLAWYYQISMTLQKSRPRTTYERDIGVVTSDFDKHLKK